MQREERELTRTLLQLWDDLVSPPRRLLPHQIPPKGNWYGWLLLAGRGAGKTEAAARYMAEHVNGPACIKRGRVPHWMSIIAPTLGDAATSCVNGPSGILTHDPRAKMVNTMGGAVVRWPNGSEAKLFGASSPDDVERLRSGGNRCLVWLEELAAWRYMEDCWNHMRFGLRVGERPHWIASTTPKPRPLIKKLYRGDISNVVVTRATMYDNPHLPSQIKADLEDTYQNTTLGDQELLGHLIEQDQRALWTRERIARNRIGLEQLPDLSKITVGVDPSGGAGEQGIVVAGSHIEVVRLEAQAPKTTREMYTLADYSCNLSPAGWGAKAVAAAMDWDADDIVVEVNYGGDMAVSTIQGAVEHAGLSIPVRKITASRGKRVRAEPVAALMERDHDHHVGTFELLEDQLCTWTDESGYSPDRLDAKVWCGWHLRLASVARMAGQGKFGGRDAASESLTARRRVG